MTFTPPPRSTVFRFSGFSPWVVSGSFCVLGSEFISLGCSWCFLRLEIFIFLLGLFQVFRNFNVRVWGVSCVIGLGSLVPAFFFLSYCPPPLSAGPGVVPFCSSVCFSSVPPTPPLNAGPWSGSSGRQTEARDRRFFVFIFFCRPADALLSSEPGGGQGKLATHTVAQDCMFCLFPFWCTLFCFLF